MSGFACMTTHYRPDLFRTVYETEIAKTNGCLGSVSAIERRRSRMYKMQP